MVVEWWRAGGQGHVLASTLPRAQNRTAKGSTLLRRRSTLPILLYYLSITWTIMRDMLSDWSGSWLVENTLSWSLIGNTNWLSEQRRHIFSRIKTILPHGNTCLGFHLIYMPLCVKQTPGINPALPHAWLPHAWHCLPANCTCEASTWFCLTFSFSWFSLPWWMWDGFFLYAVSRKKSSSPFFPSSLFDSYSYNMLSFFLFVYAVGENGQLKVPMLTNKQKITAILIYRTTIYLIYRTILPVHGIVPFQGTSLRNIAIP